jgi:pyruvate formate lyase activating enzyme
MVRAERGRCVLCGDVDQPIPRELPLCRSCILNDWSACREYADEARREARASFGVPLGVPKDGVPCAQCVNVCRIPVGAVGYCGIRKATDEGVVPAVEGAVLEWYYDPLPTNCVATPFCPGGSRCGYPRYSRAHGPEYGYHNLAVFYGACNFTCLYCQNWRFRSLTARGDPRFTAEELAAAASDKTACICYFGGDPTPQMEHALETARIAREDREKLRICFETNGSMNRDLARRMADVVYDSGGCVKVDFKTWHEELGLALSGASNRWTINNFRWLARYAERREDRGVPFLVASTLMVPGYVEAEEVGAIASFIAGLDPDIPYVLLAFFPHFRMRDMPLTSRATAQACLEAAREAGLRRVRVGNVHLLA